MDCSPRNAEAKRTEANGSAEALPRTEVNRQEMDLILDTWKLIPPEAVLPAVTQAEELTTTLSHVDLVFALQVHT